MSKLNVIHFGFNAKRLLLIENSKNVDDSSCTWGRGLSKLPIPHLTVTAYATKHAKPG